MGCLSKRLIGRTYYRIELVLGNLGAFKEIGDFPCTGCCPEGEEILSGYLNSYLGYERSEIKLTLQLVKKQQVLIVSQERVMCAHFGFWTTSYLSFQM